MSERREYEMSQEDLDGIMKKINDARSTPLILLQCGIRPSLQEVANDAWKELGDRMGFDHMTVRPTGKGDRFFSAVPK